MNESKMGMNQITPEKEGSTTMEAIKKYFESPNAAKKISISPSGQSAEITISPEKGIICRTWGWDSGERIDEYEPMNEGELEEVLRLPSLCIRISHENYSGAELDVKKLMSALNITTGDRKIWQTKEHNIRRGHGGNDYDIRVTPADIEKNMKENKHHFLHSFTESEV